MPRSLSARLKVLAVFISLALIFVLGAAFYLSSSIRAVARQQDWVEHSYLLINQFESILSSLKDAEDGERGYFLQPNNRSLETRNQGVRAVWAQLDRVRMLTSDNPVQQANVMTLGHLIEVRIRLLDDSMSRFSRRKRFEDVADTFLASQESMSAVRRQVTTLEEVEHSILKSRSAALAEQERYVLIILVLATVIEVALIGAFWRVFHRHMIDQDADLRRKSKEAWIKSDEAEAASVLGGELSVEEMSRAMVTYVARKMRAPAVNFYLQKDGELQAQGSALRRSFKIGQGLVGRAAELDEIVTFNDVPADFFRLESALGSAVPAFVVYAPVRFRSERLGLIEIALFEKMDADRTEWLRHITDSFGVSLSASLSRDRLSDLLEETQRQSEELQMQQEEMRTSNEELEEQTKALLASQNQLQVQAEELRQVNEELESQTRALESQQESLSLKNQALETARRNLEAKAGELARANSYKSEFLAKMSHELRTPLNSMMILATILRENREKNLTPQQAEFARTIYASGGELLELINDILDLSKLEARKLAARPEPFSLRGFLHQINLSFATQAEAKGLRLKISSDENVPDRVVQDRFRMLQILRNLISNALKFTEQGGVEVRLELVPDQTERMRFVVTDSGIGIPEQKKRLIWEAFEQADSSVSRKYGGTGLGLTISRELAGLLGGQISMESVEGQGSRFTLELPMILNMVEPPSPSAEPSAQKRDAPPREDEQHGERHGENHGERHDASVGALHHSDERPAQIGDDGNGDRSVLIIEDDARFRHAVADVARGHGFFPLQAGSGAEALEILATHRPHGILLDNRLSEEGGSRLLNRIRAIPHMRDVPVHLISLIDYQDGVSQQSTIGSLNMPVPLNGVRAALGRIESFIEKKVKRLLIVEDDDVQRKAIVDLVKTGDIEILAVKSGQRALEILRGEGADCMILDLKLPDMSGFELLDSLGQTDGVSLPPIIVYTGKDLSKAEEDRLRRFSDSIILKGVKSPERLLDEVNLFLHRVERDSPVENGPSGATTQRERSFQGKSLLLVDDDVRNLFALTSALEAAGFAVTVARNGLEALERLEARPETDIVLMDIMMPKMDGFEAIKHIRENPRFVNLPIIALTAKAMKGEHERCVKAGANDYLSKPINLGRLFSVLKVWIAPDSAASARSTFPMWPLTPQANEEA